MSSMIWVRRSSPYSFWTSCSSLTIRSCRTFSEPEDFQVLGDAALDVGQLVQNLLLLHAGQALQLQLDDGLGLLFGELEPGDQGFARFARIAGGADQLDDRVEIVERLLETEQEMLALAGFAQLVIGAAPHHVHAVVDEALDAIDQAQFARLAIDDRQHDDAKAGLQLGLLVQIVENDLGLLAALQFEHDAHAVAVALVADFGDAFELLVVDQARQWLRSAAICLPDRESR